jgi:hypothetical protein
MRATTRQVQREVASGSSMHGIVAGRRDFRHFVNDRFGRGRIDTLKEDELRVSSRIVP